jgi:hypothetical protein
MRPLRALTFSGASEIANDFGDAWADMHLPFAATINPAYQEPTSGMTADHVRQVVPYIEDCLFLALKTNWPANRPEPPGGGLPQSRRTSRRWLLHCVRHDIKQPSMSLAIPITEKPAGSS